MIDAILIIFPPSSAIPSASGESNPSRRALRYYAAIIRADLNLWSAIPRMAIAFVAFVDLITITTIGIAPSHRRPVSLLVLYSSMGWKQDGFDRQADSR